MNDSNLDDIYFWPELILKNISNKFLGLSKFYKIYSKKLKKRKNISKKKKKPLKIKKTKIKKTLEILNNKLN